MLFGLEWYWWVAIGALVVALIPFKLRFASWWSKRRKERDEQGRWGEGE